jgi:hypothetical protein
MNIDRNARRTYVRRLEMVQDIVEGGLSVSATPELSTPIENWPPFVANC